MPKGKTDPLETGTTQHEEEIVVIKRSDCCARKKANGPSSCTIVGSRRGGYLRGKAGGLEKEYKPSKKKEKV